MKVLISGTSSGLGKFLLENLKATPYKRGMDIKELEDEYDVIIHAAFDNSFTVKSNDLYEYYKNNIKVTEELLNIGHKKFIFLSSIDVYEYADRTEDKLEESLELVIRDKIKPYSLFKLIAEELVKKLEKNYLILRPSAMLGVDSRKNSLIRILTELNTSLTLSEKSSFNYITHQEVLEFVQIAIKGDICGIYNLVSNDNITLKEITADFGKKVDFGNYHYKTMNISNKKINNICNIFNKSSLKVVHDFYDSLV